MTWHPQIFEDQLTLFQPGGGRLCPPNNTGTPGFSNLPTIMPFHIRYLVIYSIHYTSRSNSYFFAREKNDSNWTMMMLEIVLCFLTISGLGASFEIEISRAQVAIKNGSFSPARTVLDCNSASQKHVYCCWIAPQMKDCKCDEKDCPLDGVSVTSDQRKCSLTIEHQDASANSGQWTCQLYKFAPEVKIANASTELFIINVNEVSYYVLILVLDSAKECQCKGAFNN